MALQIDQRLNRTRQDASGVMIGHQTFRGHRFYRKREVRDYRNR